MNHAALHLLFAYQMLSISIHFLSTVDSLAGNRLKETNNQPDSHAEMGIQISIFIDPQFRLEASLMQGFIVFLSSSV